MIRYKNFREIIEKTAGPEECKKRFENFVFGELLGKKEKDTKEEGKIFDLLISFFFASDIGSRIGEKKAPRLVNAIKKLLECKKYFKILKETNKPFIYRGITLKEDVIVSFIKASKNLVLEKGDEDGEHFIVTDKMKYVPGSAAESWTTDFETARRFSTRNVPKNQESAINKLDAKKNRDSILFKGDVSDRIKKKSNLGFGKEFEVIRVGKNTKASLIINKHDINRMAPELNILGEK